MNNIVIKGARSHNLKGFNLSLPRNKLIVITGLSGSGKSSLAFDTIYAEGQRRYVESLSAYARQFLEIMAKPEVDLIEGLSPAIAIDQKSTSRNPRSTVGTITEIYDYIRLLFARVGTPYSPATGLPIKSQTVSQMVDSILKFEEGKRILILAPIVRSRKGTYQRELIELTRKGFQRVQIDGEIYSLQELPILDKQKKHDIEVIVDRLVIAPKIEGRLVDSIETSLKLSDGLLIAQDADSKEQHIYSEKFACPVTGFTLKEIEPRMFSFNSPFGSCKECDGLGYVNGFEESLIIPNRSLSIKDEDFVPFRGIFSRQDLLLIESMYKKYKCDIDTPFSKIPKELEKKIFYGSDELFRFNFQDDRGIERTYEKKFAGIIPVLTERLSQNQSDDFLKQFCRPKTCHKCHGSRLNEEALCVKIGGKDISQVSALTVKESVAWFNRSDKFLSKQEQEISQRILREILERLEFLNQIGLDYLSLNRMSRTLSGGESQRIRLASQIGSGLTGVLYVLDEPSIGLHQRDNSLLISTLIRLRDLGNTVIVVEHDEETISKADFIVDMGPRAGIHGGEIIAKGSVDKIKKSKKSLTGQYLSRKKTIPTPTSRRVKIIETKDEIQKTSEPTQVLTIKNASGNNLKNVTVDIPLKAFSVVTGVSGSGKSTLVNQTLLPALDNLINRKNKLVLPCDSISGFEWIDKIIEIDQSPIGRTPRSNPATYTGVFTLIREWFASLPEAKARGYSASRFSFNVKGGRCEKCRGDGLIKIEMHFLPEVYVVCDSCEGKRYNRDTLQIMYKSTYNISDILEMTVEEAVSIFKAMPDIRRKLETLKNVGLGYIRLGQQATTLSGGEAQRIKLSRELAKPSTDNTLYILDEPTTGLHFDDIKMLLSVLQLLVDSGNTVVVVEHNLDVIKSADWVIDLGLESGNLGGNIVTCGTPEHIAKSKKSYTAKFLKPLLS